MTATPTFNPLGTKARIYCGVECRPWDGFGIFTVYTKLGDDVLPMLEGSIDEGATLIRCALMAAVTGLKNLPDEQLHVDIVTPSTWVTDTGNKPDQIERWHENEWKKDDGEVVPHADLWQQLKDLGQGGDSARQYAVSFTYSGELGPTTNTEMDADGVTTVVTNGSAAAVDSASVADCQISYNVATLGHSGIGAYVIRLDLPGQSKEMSSKLGVTNYARLNLLACIDAVRSAVDILQPRGNRARRAQTIQIATPSDFVADAVNKGWLVRWSQNGWQRNDEERVRNADLWQQFYRLTRQHDIEVRLALDTMEIEKLGIRARELAVKDNTKLKDDAEFQKSEEQDVREGRTIRIFSDGAARDNPGNGGWGVVMEYKGKRKPQSKGYKSTTNNRMELMGPIWALEQLVDLTARGKVPDAVKVIVVTDSSYVVDAMTKGWAKRWRKNKWIKQNGDRAKNTDLWNRMLRAIDRLKRVEFRWVRGHGGNPANELADSLARKAADQPAESLADDEGFEGGQPSQPDQPECPAKPA